MKQLIRTFLETFDCIPFTIELSKHLEGLGRADIYYNGMIPVKAVILLDKDLGAEDLAKVLIHEMTHCVRQVIACSEEEHPEIFWDVCNAFTMYYFGE